MREEIEEYGKILASLAPLIIIYVWSVFYNFKLGILLGAVIGAVMLIVSLRYLNLSSREKFIYTIICYIIFATLLYIGSNQAYAVFPYTFSEISALDIVVNALITSWIIFPIIIAIVFANFFRMPRRTLFLLTMLVTAGINLLLGILFLGVSTYLDISPSTFMDALTSHPLASYSGTLMVIIAPVIAILVRNAIRG